MDGLIIATFVICFLILIALATIAGFLGWSLHKTSEQDKKEKIIKEYLKEKEKEHGSNN